MKRFSFAIGMIFVLSSLSSCVSTPEPVVETVVVVETTVTPVPVAEPPAEVPDATTAASDEGWETPAETLEPATDAESTAPEMTELPPTEETDATTAASEDWE